MNVSGGSTGRRRAGRVVGRGRSSDTVRMIRAGRPTATTSLGSVVPGGTSVPSPRKTRSPRRAPGIRIEALPISQRSPTVAPTTRQRCPNVVRRPTDVAMPRVPMTTEFSITAEPVPTLTPDARDRMTAPSDSNTPSPRRAVPITTAEDAICGERARRHRLPSLPCSCSCETVLRLVARRDAATQLPRTARVRRLRAIGATSAGATSGTANERGTRVCRTHCPRGRRERSTTAGLARRLLAWHPVQRVARPPRLCRPAGSRSATDS